MSIEAGVVLGARGKVIHWHLPGDRSGGALPDSRDLWDVMWEHREIVRGFAHSHPGSGDPWYSQTDATTFAAVEAGLGQRLDWWIITSDGVALFRWMGPERLDYRKSSSLFHEVSWVDKLRVYSRYPDHEEPKGEVDEREAAIRADERQKVLDAARRWAGELRYAPWPAWTGDLEGGLRSGFEYVKNFLTEEALKKYL